MTLYKKIMDSPLGAISLVADDEGLIGAWFLDQKHCERGLEAEPILATSPILEETQTLLSAYFAGERPDLQSLSFQPQGTYFQRRVWAALQEIPHGQLTTYGLLAEKLGLKSAQAIGQAVGRNPLSILIPCHRVVGSQGQLTGYAGGLDRKIALLKLEGHVIDEQQRIKEGFA